MEITTQTLFKETPEFEKNGFYIDVNGYLTISPNLYYKIEHNILYKLFSKIQNFTGRIQVPGYDLEGNYISFNTENNLITANKLIIHSIIPFTEIRFNQLPLIFNVIKSVDNLEFSQFTTPVVIGIMFGDCNFIKNIPTDTEITKCAFVDCTIPNLDKLKNFTKIKDSNFYNCTDNTAKKYPDFTINYER